MVTVPKAQATGLLIIQKIKTFEYLKSCKIMRKFLQRQKNYISCDEVYYYLSTTFAGLPQLGYPEVEPIILDELHIALGGGPNGYRAQFRNITARGVSSLRITGLRTRLSDDEVQLQLAFSIPKIRAGAKYRSSGTLILVQASGAGDYWGEYGKYFKTYISSICYTIQQHNLFDVQLC